MDEAILLGYNRLIDLINTKSSEIDNYTEQIKEQDAILLSHMGKSTMPVVLKIGLEMMERGKKGNQDEIYDARHYQKKMIILGKSTEPSIYRPDNINKKVDDQFCLLGEDGKFYELMYSSDEHVIDSYLAELTSKQVIDLYGIEIMFILYKAMIQYLENQEILLAALDKTLFYIKTGTVE